jgi:hypothetical protein
VRRKLSPEQVKALREEWANLPEDQRYGFPNRAGKKLGMDGRAIRKILSGQTYKDGVDHSQKANPEMVREIRVLASLGLYKKIDIAKHYGLTYHAVSKIANGRNWKDVE